MKRFLAFIIMGLATLVFVEEFAHAMEFDDDDADSSASVSQSGSKATQDKARLRLYNGGRDEQELRVQASLPTPARSVDGQWRSTTPIESTSHD